MPLLNPTYSKSKFILNHKEKVNNTQVYGKEFILDLLYKWSVITIVLCRISSGAEKRILTILNSKE